jgi:geranylgeranyl diphosphate synthase, type II
MTSTQDLTSPTTAFDLVAYLTDRQPRIEAALDVAVSPAYPDKIYDAMRYSLLAGGKRLRPILCLASCEAIGGAADLAMPMACALEMIHTMSLIHDDLPAMDDDDYRRGKLTNHKVYGEDIAILAGDGLLAYAFEYIATQTRGVSADRVLRSIAHLAKASGAGGLVGGQVVDLESEGQDISVETLTYIHKHKTGALLEASVVCGAMMGGATEPEIEKLSQFAQNIGLAFQIIDDILDITATQAELGKTPGKDLQSQKATYPKLWGLAESKHQADKLVAEAKQILAEFGDRGIPLQALADYITDRKN